MGIRWCICKIPFVCVLVLLANIVYAQNNKDTANILNNINLPVKNRFINNVFQQGVNSIRHDLGDTIDAQSVLIVKSENAFKQYEGKIIRHIIIKRFNFERTFSDTSNRIDYIGTKILNLLHTDTREWAVRNNLFIHKNTTLNPYKLAENERFLRTLDFIQDSRIFVYPIDGAPDSVDVVVITKDFFTISGVVDASINSVKLRVAEANFLGGAQRIQFAGLWGKNRNPHEGYEALYSKNNIGGSFINGTIAYSQINGGIHLGKEDETAVFLRLEHPLVSMFSHVAGGMELSYNEAINDNNKPDSLFYNYQYNVYNVWVGYNFSANIFNRTPNNDNHKNLFISLRFLQNDFLKRPYQIGDSYNPVYNNKTGILGQVSLYKQEYYKLNYVYGFGTTEDIPYGFNVSVTGGWIKQLDLGRPYIGFQVTQNVVTPLGGFVNATFKTGGFYDKNTFEDAATLASVNFFTRLFLIKKMKFRELVQFSYAQIKNRLTTAPLYLNNNYGLRDFQTDSVSGDRRISLYAESVLYGNKKVLGFRFAAFAFGNLSLLSNAAQPFVKSDIYSGWGGGFRTRNENLIFGTIELRAVYLPRPVFGLQKFHVDISSDIRFRYRSSFVKAPDIVEMNVDEF